MKKYIMFAAAVALMSFASLAHAQETQTEATVTKVTGSATFKVAGGAAQAIAVGTKLPQGAEITTADKSNVTIQAHDGIVAIAGEKTTIAVEKLSVSGNGTRNAVIGLKSGNLASSLDPSKKNQNNYSVRTPKGVAAARGTTYSVSYDGVTYSVTVVAGVVQSFTATGASVNVNVGQVSSNTDAGVTTQTLAEAIAAPGSTVGEGVALLAAAVASVSNNIQDVAAVINTIASSAGTGQAATNVVASATAAAAGTAAVMLANTTAGGSMGAAEAIVNAAVSGSAAAGNSAAASTIVATSTVAVVTTTGISVSSVATALTETANNTAGVSVNATNVTNAATTTIENTGGANATTTIVEVTQPGGETTVVETPVVTPVTPVNPDISVSPAGS